MNLHEKPKETSTTALVSFDEDFDNTNDDRVHEVQSPVTSTTKKESTTRRTKMTDDTEKYVRVHDEQMNRFVSQITLAKIKIPGIVWPGLTVGQGSTKENLIPKHRTKTVLNERAVTQEDYELEFRFVRDWWEELNSGESKPSRSEKAAYKIIKRDVMRYSNGRFAWTNGLEEYGTTKAVKCEFVDTCFPAVQMLGTTRLTEFEHLDEFAQRFEKQTKLLQATIVDMEQCKNLLRQTIREFCVTESTSATTAADMTTLTTIGRDNYLRNATRHEIEITIKECIAFLSSLQTRKWATIVRIARLRRRVEMIEQNQGPANEAIASDVYRTTIQQLRNERDNAIHVSRQIETMQELIDATRKLTVAIYMDLYKEWKLSSETTEMLINTLRDYRVAVHPLVRQTLERDAYVLDFFRTLEIVRQTNVLSLKQVEDTYDETYNEMLPSAQRNTPRVSLNACSNDDPSQGTTESSIQQIFRAVQQLNSAIETTRENYRNGRWDSAPADIRMMTLSFHRLIERRVTRLKHERKTSPAIVATETENVPKNTDELEHASIDRFVAKTLNRHEQEYLTGQITQSNTIEGDKKWLCRPIGDTVVMLRDTQDSYDINCLLKTLDKHFNRTLNHKLTTENIRSVNEETVCSNWNERRYVDELESVTQTAFGENVGSWNNLIGRLRSIEKESVFDSKSNAIMPRIPYSMRIENWCLHEYDTFHLTLIHSRFTQIDNIGDLTNVQRIIADYAYLLSWMLQMRTYVSDEQISDEEETARENDQWSRQRDENRNFGSRGHERTRQSNEKIASDSDKIKQYRGKEREPRQKRKFRDVDTYSSEEEQVWRRPRFESVEKASGSLSDHGSLPPVVHTTTRPPETIPASSAPMTDDNDTTTTTTQLNPGDDDTNKLNMFWSRRAENRRLPTEAERKYASRRLKERIRDEERRKTARRLARKRRDDDDDGERDDQRIVYPSKRRRSSSSRNSVENSETQNERPEKDDSLMEYTEEDPSEDEFQGDVPGGKRKRVDSFVPQKRKRLFSREKISGNEQSLGKRKRQEEPNYDEPPRKRGQTERLRQLLRMAEHSPSDINMQTLNETFRDETNQRRKIQRNIRSNLQMITDINTKRHDGQ